MNSPDAFNIDCLFLRTEYVSFLSTTTAVIQFLRDKIFSFISFPKMLQLRKRIFDSGPQ